MNTYEHDHNTLLSANATTALLDNTTQYNHQLSYKDPDDPERVTSETRKLGLVVIRGTQVSLVSPEEGTEEIANPFLGGDEEE
eukprot:scaffold72_cov88-Skeletonema_dohrnii-CCMP3373.AAC.6